VKCFGSPARLAIEIAHDSLCFSCSTGPRSKTTSNVRRILMSQKTFKNYLDDEEAALAQNASSAQRPGLPKAVKSTGPSPRSSVPATPKPRNTAESKITTSVSTPASDTHPAPPSQQLIVSEFDNDPLLRSYIPSAPSARIMQQLLAEPPLSYNASRAKLPPSGAAQPRRHFCGICGYWGRIKCIGCGARVCRLECYKIHKETRCDRFYG
jgi:zinc finger HIT domain-containing protein 1